MKQQIDFFWVQDKEPFMPADTLATQEAGTSSAMILT